MAVLWLLKSLTHSRVECILLTVPKKPPSIKMGNAINLFHYQKHCIRTVLGDVGAAQGKVRENKLSIQTNLTLFKMLMKVMEPKAESKAKSVS